GIAFMVFILFFEPDLFIPIGIGGGLTCAWAIGFAIEGRNQKPLTAEQKKRVKWLTIVGLILLSIFALFGIYMWLG
ncbi:MAG: hypothetical protein H3Z49_00640, partial [archaeon]|nr:hypothetical protein [archaeon]